MELESSHVVVLALTLIATLLAVETIIVQLIIKDRHENDGKKTKPDYSEQSGGQ